MLVYVLVLTLLFIQPLARLMLHAAGSDLHSHILLVPFIAGYLLYSQRGSLPAPGRRSIAGTALLGGIGLAALAAAIAWRGSLSVNDHLALMALAFVSFVAAGGFLFLGSRWMAAAAFPVAFLIFMVPLPDAAVNWLEKASALASAEAAALYFSIAGTPLVRHGTVFELPGIVLRGGPGVQRDPLQLGAVHHQPAGVPSLSQEPVAADRAGGLRDSARDPAERVPGLRHRTALRPRRAPHDRQRHSPPGRPLLLRAVPGSAVPAVVVVAAPGAAGDVRPADRARDALLRPALRGCGRSACSLAVASVLRKKPSPATWCFFAGMAVLGIDSLFTGLSLRATELPDALRWLTLGLDRQVLRARGLARLQPDVLARRLPRVPGPLENPAGHSRPAAHRPVARLPGPAPRGGAGRAGRRSAAAPLRRGRQGPERHPPRRVRRWS